MRSIFLHRARDIGIFVAGPCVPRPPLCIEEVVKKTGQLRKFEKAYLSHLWSDSNYLLLIFFLKSRRIETCSIEGSSRKLNNWPEVFTNVFQQTASFASQDLA